MSDRYQTGDTGYCSLVGHTSAMILTWEDNTVIAVECATGNHETCEYSGKCDFYQRHPVGFVQTYPSKDKSV